METSLGNGAQPQPRDIAQHAVRILNAALAILSARTLATIAMLGAVTMFGFAAYAPDRERTIVAALYALLVLVPMLWTMAKKG